ncbi:LLM class flavin-dependent oxidoreductase [Cryobacterium sp. SO2]|uniref:LLM class flavin-dependent oxidoreductase n=1 Tax=Cryobacterium sp. SO2 TaxID=1897060 RepID=UPI00223DB7F7|nr:LLM class flavin-dependent oxidoreductase [Cryobacterium sp. SO2]WEO77189.1 LLM class flavin-dependent oxidoreductase [Cryobacterium sp. SO2]
MTSRRRELGFLSFVPNPYGPDHAARALDDGLRLFEHAEQLGFDIGWIRSRHFEEYPSSPLTFLAAASQRTRRIRLGTGVIPMRYEDPIRLAEDAATVDLLSGGRLELGVSSGIPQFAPILDPVFGVSGRGFANEAQHRLGRLRTALAGTAVARSGNGFMSIPSDTDLAVTPRAAGLANRVWYGPGTLAGATRTGEQGLNIQVSTLNSEETGASFAGGQAAQLRAYKRSFARATAGSGRTPRLAAGRIILPFCDPRDADAYAEFIHGYNARMQADGRPYTSSVPMRFDRVHSGEPARIVDGLLADEALNEVTEITVTLPSPGGLDAHLRTLDAVAAHIAPALGWTPAA